VCVWRLWLDLNGKAGLAEYHICLAVNFYLKLTTVII